MKIGIYYTKENLNKALKRNKKRYKKIIVRKNKSKKGFTIYGYERKKS